MVLSNGVEPKYTESQIRELVQGRYPNREIVRVAFIPFQDDPADVQIHVTFIDRMFIIFYESDIYETNSRPMKS